MITSVPARASSSVTLLEERFRSAWAKTDEIFGLIKSDAFLSKPIVWRHPFLFYVGHLPAFSWNQICGAILDWESFNPHFDDIFYRGIDPDVDTGDCHWHPETPEQWPVMSEVITYRDKVRGALLDSIDAIFRGTSTDFMAQRGRCFNMVLEHEYMHQETLLYMLQEAPFEIKIRPRQAPRYSFEREAASAEIKVTAGSVTLGTDFSEIDFGWDNEFQKVTTGVPGFEIDSLPVTNRQFFEFVECGAHEDPQWWLKQDWDWKERFQIKHPRSWLKRGDDWFYRTLFDTMPLTQVLGWPVYVSLAEARAYAKWRGQRLPTEAEFHRAAYTSPDGTSRRYPWGNMPPVKAHGNFDFAHGSPNPVGSNPAGASAWGVQELVGNGWEWTDTPFRPFSGFTAYIRSYPDYSADFFDGKHFVLKGASWATSADLIRPSFRNWYQAHYPFVFAKFRCASDV